MATVQFGVNFSTLSHRNLECPSTLCLPHSYQCLCAWWTSDHGYASAPTPAMPYPFYLKTNSTKYNFVVPTLTKMTSSILWYPILCTATLPQRSTRRTQVLPQNADASNSRCRGNYRISDPFPHSCNSANSTRTWLQHAQHRQQVLSVVGAYVWASARGKVAVIPY